MRGPASSTRTEARSGQPRWVRPDRLARSLSACILLFAAHAACAEPPALQVRTVAPDVHAIVGPLGNRTPENLGSNATFGFVVTTEGVVLVDPGATHRGASQLHQLIASVTDQPVRVVINTGGQDHRWLGNDYFRQRGAKVIASEAAVADQKARARDQLIVLGALVGDAEVETTEPAFADVTFAESHSFTLGGTRFEIHHAGPAHTPGDSFVWLPRERILFSGDIVYVERMLGIIDVSASASWIDAFERMAAFAPERIVPGHGRIVSLAEARVDTLDYLVFLRGAVRQLMESGGGIEEVGAIDQARFSYLQNFDLLRGRNAQRVYEEMEWE